MVSLRLPQAHWLQRAFHAAVSQHARWSADRRQGLGLGRRHVQSVMLVLAMITGTTLCLLGITVFVTPHHVSSAYLLAVLIAAIRVGVGAAIFAAIGGVLASAYFFYPPIYDFRVSDPAQLLDLSLFVVVAAVTGQLAASARSHALLAEERESRMRALYAFSRRLAVATDASQIYSAIQDHLSTISGAHVVYFEAGAQPAKQRRNLDTVPPAVQRAVDDLAQRGGAIADSWIEDQRAGTFWWVRAVSQNNAAFGFVAIDVGRTTRQDRASTQSRIDAVLADASATLERLDVARAIGEVKLRADRETLRDALIGSVSHGLRTPLASIMGSASILARTPVVAREPPLAELAGIVREEAERLNSEIQRLLDATRISSAGLHPHTTWADVADIVNAAAARHRKRLSTRQLVVQVSDDLPLVNVDPVLIEQALGQLLDNAFKYSPGGPEVRVEALSRAGGVAISIVDRGVGLTAEERERIFERFYRSPRTSETASGSGLGLWIARAFVAACGGTIEAASDGAGCGSELTIVLPRALLAPDNAHGGQYE